VGLDLGVYAPNSVNEHYRDISPTMDERARSVDVLRRFDENYGVMRMLQWGLLVAVCAMSLAGDDTHKVGYVDCSSRDKHLPTPVFSNPCISKAVGSLSCGEKVEVLGREGPWLRIASTDTDERYIGVTSVSQKKNRFVALDFPVPSEPYTRDCSAFRPKTGKVQAQPIYHPDPEYTKQARSAGIQGSVTLALTIGTDGRVHEVKVLSGLGYGLDEKAVEAVQSWRFEPALEEGTPIESKMAVDISFRSGK
jgi:TonB family protein